MVQRRVQHVWLCKLMPYFPAGWYNGLCLPPSALERPFYCTIQPLLEKLQAGHCFLQCRMMVPVFGKRLKEYWLWEKPGQCMCISIQSTCKRNLPGQWTYDEKLCMRKYKSRHSYHIIRDTLFRNEPETYIIIQLLCKLFNVGLYFSIITSLTVQNTVNLNTQLEKSNQHLF